MQAPSLTLSPLVPADIPAALRLSAAAGWNQLEINWQRLVHLWPDTCLAGRLDGRLVATATLATFGRDLAWIGMLLVDPAHRRQGFGRTIFDAILQRAHELKILRLGLDATDFGRPLYEQRHFVAHADIFRYRGRAAAALSDPIAHPIAHPIVHPNTSPLQSGDWPALLELDRAASHIDRAALLRRLASEPAASVRLIRSDQIISAFAFSRSGREHYIGPVIARHPGLALALINTLRSELPSDHSLLIDVPAASPVNALLLQLGFTVSRRLARMYRPPFTDTHPLIHALASLELG